MKSINSFLINKGITSNKQEITILQMIEWVDEWQAEQQASKRQKPRANKKALRLFGVVASTLLMVLIIINTWIHGFLTHYMLKEDNAPMIAVAVFILITFKLVILAIAYNNK